MANRILINREECEVRVAFLEDQNLVELHTEKADEQTIVNNIYRGRVQDVVPGLQAAFIDVGLPRNMFLHFMDIRPESLVLGDKNQGEAIRKASEKTLPGRIERKGRRPRQDPHAPQAAAPVRKGDQIIVQVVKDEIGGKAPRVTANLSLAGRYLVMLPFPSQDGGVSRKIAVGQDRFRLKKLLSDLRTDDFSFIVRTAGIDQPEEAIRKDAEALQRTWESILRRYKQVNGPGLVHNDHDLIARLVRDAFPSEFEEVICDNPADVEEIKFQLEEVLPGTGSLVKLYDGVENLFERHGVDQQIEKSMARKYWLKSGGYLIIDENEALTAIDVNTGRFTGKKDQEKTSLKTNTEACEAIAQQIRLRDIGGIIVIDFIDMLSRAHQERVSEELRRQLRNDRAKTAIGRIGDFGLMMLTRKRHRMSLQNHLYDECPYCNATGLVLKNDEIVRKLKYDIRKMMTADQAIRSVLVSAHARLVDAMQSRYQRFVEEIRRTWHCELVFRADPDMHVEDFVLTPVKGGGRATYRMPVRIDDAKRILPAIEGISLGIPDEDEEELEPAGEVFLDRIDSVDDDFEDDAEGDDEADEAEPLIQSPPPAQASPASPSTGGRGRGRREPGPPQGRQQKDPAPRGRQQRGPAPQGQLQKEPAAQGEQRREPAPQEGQQRSEPGGNRRRRRRESSSERRARRRRAREMEAGGILPPEGAPTAAARGRDLADDRITPPVDQVDVPRPAELAPVRLDSFNNADSEFDEDDDSAEVAADGQSTAGATVPAGDQPRKKTRRGRRGGRGRRRRDGQGAPEGAPANAPLGNDSAVTPVPVAVSTPPPPKEVAPLRLNTPRKPKLDILESVLDQIEQQVVTLKVSPEGAAGQHTPVAAASEPSAGRSGRRRGSRPPRAATAEEVEVAPPPVVEEEDEFVPPDVTDDVPVKRTAKGRRPRPARKPVAATPVPVETPKPEPARGRKRASKKAEKSTTESAPAKKPARKKKEKPE